MEQFLMDLLSKDEAKISLTGKVAVQCMYATATAHSLRIMCVYMSIAASNLSNTKLMNFNEQQEQEHQRPVQANT